MDDNAGAFLVASKIMILTILAYSAIRLCPFHIYANGAEERRRRATAGVRARRAGVDVGGGVISVE